MVHGTAVGVLVQELSLKLVLLGTSWGSLEANREDIALSILDSVWVPSSFKHHNLRGVVFLINIISSLVERSQLSLVESTLLEHDPGLRVEA
jgi:hypothetical protein